jgi:hypothetical protein
MKATAVQNGSLNAYGSSQILRVVDWQGAVEVDYFVRLLIRQKRAR